MLEALRAQCIPSSAFHELAGIASELNGNFPVAAQQFQEAFSLNPQLSNDPKLILWFVQALVESNQAPRLVAFLNGKPRVLSPPVLFSVGMLLAKHRDYALAIKYLNQIQPASPMMLSVSILGWRTPIYGNLKTRENATSKLSTSIQTI